MTTSYDFRITPADTKILVAFRRWLNTRGFAQQTTFTSDDLREFVETHKEFQQYFTDSVHDYGTFMAKLKVNKFIAVIGETPSKRESNHRRKIDIAQFIY